MLKKTFAGEHPDAMINGHRIIQAAVVCHIVRPGGIQICLIKHRPQSPVLIRIFAHNGAGFNHMTNRRGRPDGIVIFELPRIRRPVFIPLADFNINLRGPRGPHVGNHIIGAQIVYIGFI